MPRSIEEIKAEIAWRQKHNAVDNGYGYKTVRPEDELRAALTSDIPLDRLEQICNAERDGRCVVRDPAEDHCHYTMTDDNVNLWQCSACGEEWVFDSGDPEENNVNYCMRCGRKLTRDAAAAALKEQEAKK